MLIDLATGETELVAEELEILNTSKVPVFEIDSTDEASEELRLTSLLDLIPKVQMLYLCAISFARLCGRS